MALHGRYLFDQGRVRSQKAHAPACHGVALREAVEHGHLLGILGKPANGAGHFGRGEHKLVVNFIRKHKQPARNGPIHDGRKFGLGVDRASGVAGRVQNEQPGFIRGVRLKHGGRHLEALFRPGQHRHGGCAGQHDHIGVAEPVRGRHKHLVAGVERRLHEIIEAVLAARADNNGFHRHRNAVVSFKIRARGLAEFGNARHGGVAAKIVVNSRFGSLANVFGRRKVRLAHGKADY